jgi:hypothetical protein
MKSKLPNVFTYLMRQQNADMTNAAAIPIFGYTPEARKQQIVLDGDKTTVELAVATTPHIIRIEATPSTWNLHKYLIIVAKQNKDEVQKSIKHIFNKIKGKLDKQPENFPIPRCGGREKPDPASQIAEKAQEENKMSAYMVNLERLASAQNPQDAGPLAPPKKPRRFTISYASAAKAGIIESNENASDLNKKFPPSENKTREADEHGTFGKSDVAESSSLSRTLDQSKIQTQPSRKDIDMELKELKENIESRMQKQDEQISEIIQVMTTLNRDFERRMTHVVLAALLKEKEKVQEITHGAAYDASHAPLADEDGNLPYGGKVQLGGPLDRLHHVEVTVQQMANALDTIADHLIQKDPSAKRLFITDNDSENASNQDSEEQIDFCTREQEDKYLMHHYNNDVPMQMVREFSGTKRMLGRHPGVKEAPSSSAHSPQRSPPSKREKPSDTTSANPNEHSVRERGET